MVSSSKYTAGMENFFQSVAILKATIPLAGQRGHRNHENANFSPSLVEPGPVLPYIRSCEVVRKQSDGDNGGKPMGAPDYLQYCEYWNEALRLHFLYLGLDVYAKQTSQFEPFYLIHLGLLVYLMMLLRK